MINCFMMKNLKIKLFLFSVTITSIAWSQKPFNYNVDFKNILAKTKDKDDSLNFENNLKRFVVNDTSLTDFEVLSLLIGFTGKPEYKPYADLNTEREIYKLNDEKKFQVALDLANEFLKTHPLSVKALFEKSYSFHKLGSKDSAQFYLYQGHRIFRAMFFSGDGRTVETPTFALGPADGQDYIRKFAGADIGVMGSSRDKSGNFLDTLEAILDDGQRVKLYFIIQHATQKMFKE